MAHSQVISQYVGADDDFFFIQALYNIVDSMFVAQISENALTAVSLAFPMQQVANAIAVGIGVGMSALVPHYIGLKKKSGPIKWPIQESF